MGEPLLVVGCGSIGERHLRNLLALGAGPVLACEPDHARREAVVRTYGVEAVASFEEGLARHPRAALICTPPDTHLPLALAAAHAGCHLFIEKPLAPILDGIPELRRIVEERSLVVLVACNMRLHPAIRRLKQWLDEGAVGRVLSAHAQFGHFLPNWRPGRDYRQTYSADGAAGGGILLDAIHELDYLVWFLGGMVEVACLEASVSDLTIDAEDTVDLILRAKTGALVSVHLDYNQRIKRRRCEIVGTEGTLMWESRGKNPERCVVERYSASGDRWESTEEIVDFNAPFQEEMAHFLRCLNRQDSPLQDLPAAERVLVIADAARRAAEGQMTVAVP